jgi:hypothetical protein
MARPEGFEPPTYGFEARRSIQLSYGRASVTLCKNTTFKAAQFFCVSVPHNSAANFQSVFSEVPSYLR